jgi:hypothetical protein
MSAEAISAAQAASVQGALDSLVNDTRQIQTFVWANSAARTAQTGMIAGDFGFQTDTSTTYRYSGSSWVAFYPGSNVAMIPSSVAGTGVSFSSTTGVVTFTNATSVSVNGCFTSAFANYRINWDIPTTSATLNITMQLRASGTNAATGYDRLVNGGTGAVAAPTMANNLNQTSWQVAAASTSQHHSALELWRPAVAVGTVGLLTGNGLTNPPTAASTFATQQSNLFHRTATAYDGFTLTPSTGNFTGTLRIQGYN